MTVQVVPHRVRHPLLRGVGGRGLPALLEYRLTEARVVDRPGR
jgi:hypothetical protein